MTKKIRKRRVYVKGIDQIIAADLVDMQPFSMYNNGVKYLLTVIDIFSKYGWSVLLKKKSGLEETSELEKFSMNENQTDEVVG